MDLDDIELHDAVVKAIRMDPPALTVEVDVEWHSTAISRVRSPATILFSGVTDISIIADFKQLAAHAGPGNVAYWQPEPAKGAFTIHIVGGCISVRSKAVKFLRRDTV